MILHIHLNILIIGAAQGDYNAYDLYAFNNASTTTPISGGSYVRNSIDGLQWCATNSSSDSSWNSYDASSTAIYVVLSKIRNVNLLLEAETTGGMADPDQEYTFTISFSETPSQPSQTVHLKGGENKLISLIYSDNTSYQTVTITQEAVDGYTTSVTHRVTSDSSQAVGTIGTRTYTFSARRSTNNYNYDTTVTFTNNRPVIAPTGYSGTIVPFVIIFLAGIGFAAVFFIRKYGIGLPAPAPGRMLHHHRPRHMRKRHIRRQDAPPKHGYSAARRNNINKHKPDKEVNADWI